MRWRHPRCLILLGVWAWVASASAAGLAEPRGSHARPNEWVVSLKRAAQIHFSRTHLVTSLNGLLKEGALVDFRPLRTSEQTHVLRFANSSQAQRAFEFLRSDPTVASVEPNYIYRVCQTDPTPNDPDFSRQWSMKNTGQEDSRGVKGLPGADIGILPVWNQGHVGKSEIVVAVIDTGINWDHPNLKENIYTATTPLNGFEGDLHGWNFYAHNSDSRDDHGHGSRVAGVIGAVGNQGIGIAGINWKVSLLPVKFLSSDGSGTLDAAIESINYARLRKARIMNNSWAGGGFSQQLQDAIEAAQGAGILFVSAAGNESNNNDLSPVYPGSYALGNVISVAALDNRDQLASFSNWGSKSVQVAAPGVGIYSTTLGAGQEAKYDHYSATSMAAAHVTGAAALILSENPSWNFSTLKDRLIRSSVKVMGLHRKVASAGRIQVAHALAGIFPPSIEPKEKDWMDVPMIVESEHPYRDKTDRTWPLEFPGAKLIRVVFDKIDTEPKIDWLTVESPASERTPAAEVERLSGAHGRYVSDWVEGSKILIRLKSDSSDSRWGFKISKIQVIR